MSVLVVWQLILLIIIWFADPAKNAVRQFNLLWDNIDDPDVLLSVHKIEGLVSNTKFI